jgi:hypothetical protein
MNSLIVSKRSNPVHESSAENVVASVNVDLSPSSNGTVDNEHWPSNVRLVSTL